jgi:uncharacterized protein (DUF3084 family)
MPLLDALVGALVSALAAAYFLATFAFVAYALTKYNDLKDDLPAMSTRLGQLHAMERLVKAEGENERDDARGGGGLGTH